MLGASYFYLKFIFCILKCDTTSFLWMHKVEGSWKRIKPKSCGAANSSSEHTFVYRRTPH